MKIVHAVCVVVSVAAVALSGGCSSSPSGGQGSSSSSGGSSGGSSGSSSGGTTSSSSGTTSSGSDAPTAMVTCTANSMCMGMLCCGTTKPAPTTLCEASCGKDKQVCMTATDCPAGDNCKMEPAGFGLCEHPKSDAGSTGNDGGSGEGGDDGGGDATTSDSSTDGATGG
jgi:hypothetical protein